MVAKMDQMFAPKSPQPTHPCERDLAVTRCRDAACLKSRSQGLSTPCATFLLGQEVAPSPSPEPVAAELDMSFVGDDGMPDEMKSMLEMVLPGFGALFGEPTPQPRVQKPAATNTHPCAEELQMCSDALEGTTEREPLQQCLVAHYAQLNANCKCMLHQVMGDELEAQVPAAAKAVEQPSVYAVEVTAVSMSDPEHARMHRVACPFFMGILMFSTFVLLRRLCFGCAPPPTKNVAFVPPEASLKPLVMVQPVVVSKEDALK